MRTLIIFILSTVILLISIAATGATKKIILTKNKVCQIIFPEEVKKYRGGFSPAMFALDQYENILYIQCLKPFEESNLSVITASDDYYIFDIEYKDSSSVNAYIITPDDKLMGNDKKSMDEVTSQEEVNSALEANIEKILSKKGYIFSSNGVKEKNMEVYLTGVYVDKKDIYFRLELTNSSRVPYGVNYIGFTTKSKKKGRVSSVDINTQTPSFAYTPKKEIGYNETATIIYRFNKFTVGKDRVMVIEVIENEGERNFTFEINENLILGARNI